MMRVALFLRGTLIVFSFLACAVAFGQSTPLEEITETIIPKEGQETEYGLPLHSANIEKFLTFYNHIALTPEQMKTRNSALARFEAPCCHEFSMATCCCPCILAKSVWGLANYLIAEKSFEVDKVAESALQWLRFIRTDFYIIQELQKRDIDPRKYDLKPEDSCFVGKCEFPFRYRGCGGMTELRM